MADEQKEPHLHINLPDLTGYEDKHRGILQQISDINRRKASLEDINSLCTQTVNHIRDQISDPLITKVNKLQKTQEESNKRIEQEILDNKTLRFYCSGLIGVLAMIVAVFVVKFPIMQTDIRDAEKYCIMRSYNREIDTMYYYLDRIYSSKDRKAIRAERDSMDARDLRRTDKLYKTK